MANVFTTCGTAWLAQLINATITTTTFQIGWGEGTGTAAIADTTLFTESHSRVAAAASISAFNQNQWIATMTAAAVASITNAGLFNNNSGTLLIKGNFSTVALATNDRIEFTMTLTNSGLAT